ncbi:MAG: biotin--[acetyl-CoA-carboxylase] ligase [Bacteroidota bacterium]
MHYISPSNTQFIGRHIIYEAVCASTNSRAVQCLEQQAALEGTVIITDHQYQGRGQRGQVWCSEPNKNLTFSVILFPTFLAIPNSFALNIITTLALQRVLSSYIPNGLRIKWPNDIYYRDKKLSGILIENMLEKHRLRASIIGIGLNVNQFAFTLSTPTSLSLICQRVFSLQQLFEQLLESLEHNYLQLQMQGIAVLQAAYLSNMYWIDEVHSFRDAHHTFQGVITGIDAAGRLMIKLLDGTSRHYNTQEVMFLA